MIWGNKMDEKAFYPFDIQQVRISRPTNQLAALMRFYRDGLGLEILLEFTSDAAGYGGVVFRLPETRIHLEFCTHIHGFTDPRPPTKENLLVLYISKPDQVIQLEQRMSQLGFPSVPATNPHWDKGGVTFEDPNGWRVVLMHRSNIENN